MRIVDVYNASRSQLAPIRARYCDSFACQLRGLTFRRSLHDGEGLLLVQKRESRLESAIHMLGMWIDLAVVWIDGNFRVVDVKHARRWCPAYFPAQPARYILETAVDRINDFKVGEYVRIEDSHIV